MTRLKPILNAFIAVVLTILLLPVFVWLGLVAVGAAISAILLGTSAAAWQMRSQRVRQRAWFAEADDTRVEVLKRT